MSCNARHDILNLLTVLKLVMLHYSVPSILTPLQVSGRANVPVLLSNGEYQIVCS